MRILILGGTGAIGEHLVRLLTLEGVEIYVTTRKNHTSSGSLQYIHGDAHDITFLTNLLKQKYDLIVDFMAYSTEEFYARAELLLTSCGQYFYLSSSRVYAETDKPITEESPRLLDVCKDKTYLSSDEYALAKARQENILLDSRFKNWVIIRPYITYSETRLQLGVLEKESWLFRALNGHKVVFCGDLLNRKTTLTYGYDVARGIRTLLGSSEANSQSFHITQQKSLSWMDVWNIYCDVIKDKCGYAPEMVNVDLKTFIWIHNGKYQIIYDRMYDRIFDNSKINNFCDSSLFLTPEIGLRNCLGAFMDEKRSFVAHGYGGEGKKDKITREFWDLSTIDGYQAKIKYLVRRFL